MRSWGKILLPLVIVFSALAVGQMLIGQRPKIKQNDYRQLTQNFKPENISLITLNDGKGQIEIKKAGNAWKLENLAVENSKIEEILNILLPRDQSYNLISENPSKFEELGVASQSAKTVSLSKSDGQKIEIRVGLYQGPGTFIRVDDRPAVYLIDQPLDNLITSDRQSFWLKRILSLKRAELTAIEVKSSSQTYILVKEKDNWQLKEPSQLLKKEKVDDWLSQLENLQGDKVILDPTEKRNYPQRAGTLTLKTKDNTETLNLYQNRQGLLIERTADNSLFTFNRNRLSDILPPLSQF